MLNRTGARNMCCSAIRIHRIRNGFSTSLGSNVVLIQHRTARLGRLSAWLNSESTNGESKDLQSTNGRFGVGPLGAPRPTNGRERKPPLSGHFCIQKVAPALIRPFPEFAKNMLALGVLGASLLSEHRSFASITDPRHRCDRSI
jgi:hypothetical protein